MNAFWTKISFMQFIRRRLFIKISLNKPKEPLERFTKSPWSPFPSLVNKPQDESGFSPMCTKIRVKVVRLRHPEHLHWQYALVCCVSMSLCWITSYDQTTATKTQRFVFGVIRKSDFNWNYRMQRRERRETVLMLRIILVQSQCQRRIHSSPIENTFWFYDC